MGTFITLLVLFIAAVAVRDIYFNKKHTIQHNFPVIGHLRYFFEKIGPEIRQYFVASNRDEKPFNRSERSWVYASSKNENNLQGFGSDKDFSADGHIFIRQAMFPFKPGKAHWSKLNEMFVPCAKIMGPKRAKPFWPKSIINVSAMSYGALSPEAVTALNEGSKLAGCYHNTGEGGFSQFHNSGADVVFQLGTGYYGARNSDGTFSIDKLKELVKKYNCIQAIEIKLSQGAKPGKGGVLPGAKVSKEIAESRGINIGQDSISPAYHSAFSNVRELVDFLELIAEETGLPVGIKSAIGQFESWNELADIMAFTGKGPDFITIDGGEGGTGAAPSSFADNVSLPFNEAFTGIYRIFQDRNLTSSIVFIVSGKLGLPANAIKAIAMGCDMVNVAREALMSLGCIQAQKCHTNECPAGLTTQNKWLRAGVDSKIKSVRFKNYVKTFLKEVLEISHACGHDHPSQLTMKDVNMNIKGSNQSKSLYEIYGYEKTEMKQKGYDDIWNAHSPVKLKGFTPYHLQTLHKAAEQIHQGLTEKAVSQN